MDAGRFGIGIKWIRHYRQRQWSAGVERHAILCDLRRTAAGHPIDHPIEQQRDDQLERHSGNALSPRIRA